MPATLSMRANQHAPITSVAKNGTQPGSLAGPPSWSTDNPALVDITVSPTDSFTVTVTGKNVPGTCNVTCSAQAIPFGPNISSAVAVTLTALAADHFDFVVGVPSDN